MRHNFCPQGIRGLINAMVFKVRSPNEQHQHQHHWKRVRNADFSRLFPDLLNCAHCVRLSDLRFNKPSRCFCCSLWFEIHQVYGEIKNFSTNNILLYIQNDAKRRGSFHARDLLLSRSSEFYKSISFCFMTEKCKPLTNLTWLFEITMKIWDLNGNLKNSMSLATSL